MDIRKVYSTLEEFRGDMKDAIVSFSLHPDGRLLVRVDKVIEQDSSHPEHVVSYQICEYPDEIFDDDFDADFSLEISSEKMEKRYNKTKSKSQDNRFYETFKKDIDLVYIYQHLERQANDKLEESVRDVMKFLVDNEDIAGLELLRDAMPPIINIMIAEAIYRVRQNQINS